MVEQEIKKELEHEKLVAETCDTIQSDDENDEEEYEAWKIRELRRIKRDREEREALVNALNRTYIFKYTTSFIDN